MIVIIMMTMIVIFSMTTNIIILVTYHHQHHLATPQSLGFLLGYTKFCFICYFYVFLSGVCV